MDGVKPSSDAPVLWTRRSFLTTAAATIAASRLPAEAPPAKTLVYIGATTEKPDDGIHVAHWDAASGTLSDYRLAANVFAPGFLAVSEKQDEHYLFAGHHTPDSKPGTTNGALNSYRIATSGDLTLINTVIVPNFDFVHTALDHTERCLISASYGSGKVLSCKVISDGRLSDPVSEFQLSGHGPNAARQTTPHAHGVAISPDNRFAYINDLGTDRIMIYRLNAATAQLTPNDPPYFQMKPGSGPRHLAFAPNGKWAYSVNELNSTLSLLQWNSATGTFTLLADTPTLPPGGDVADNRAGEVIIDPSGRHLYSCNRGAPEELLAYAIGPGGHLRLINRTPLQGKEARHFVLSPDGRFLLVARQFSNDVTIFARNLKTGAISPTDHHYPADNASCVVFA